jgi:WD40 repeat protein
MATDSGSESLDDLFPDPSPAETHRAKAPFKFLDPYGPEDRDIFYGRDQEIAELYSRFYRARLVVVFGESGAGKTSLIQCGLRNEVPREDALFLPVRCAVDPLGALRAELLHQLRAGTQAPASIPTLMEQVAERKSKTLVLVLDQFEELFLLQPADVRRAFSRAIAAGLEANINLRVVIGIREDYLAHLTELEGDLPGLYENRLRVLPMSRDQAQQVISRPCEAVGVGIDQALVDELLDDLLEGGQAIELPLLQVVLDALYRQAREVDPEHPVLTQGAYQGLGKAQRILARFIEDRVDSYQDPEPVRQVLKALVTDEGTRRLCPLAEIQERITQFGEAIPEAELRRVLHRLTDDRILREDADNQLFELRHDALAPPIRAWMTGLEEELMEVRQVLENRLKEHLHRGTLLDRETLAYIAPYEARLHLKGTLAGLVKRSRNAAARTRRRWLAAGAGAGVAVLTMVSILALLAYWNYLEAEAQLARARHHLGLAFNQRAERALLQRDFNAAHLYSLHALTRMEPEALEQRAAAWGTVLSSPTYPVAFSTPADAHAEGIRSIAFSPDGHLLASASGDKRIRLWEADTGKAVATLADHAGVIFAIAFSPNAKLLASASADRTIRLWEVASGKVVTTLKGHTDAVFDIAFSRGGTLLASASLDKTIRLWDLASGETVHTLEGHAGPVLSVAFSPDGQWLASGSADDTVRVWKTAGGKAVATLRGHEGPVLSVAFSPDGSLLASGSWDTTVRLWDMGDREPVATLRGHTNTVFSVAFSPDGKRLASGSQDHTLRLWHVASGEALVTLSGHTEGVTSVAFSPGGGLLASGSQDQTVRAWDMMAIRDPVTTFRGHAKGVMSIAFSPRGRLLASGGADRSVRLWEVASAGAAVDPTLTDHAQDLTSVAFSPDGKLLATGSVDNTVRLWDVAAREQLATLDGHTKRVASVAFSTGGRLLASGSWDHTLRLWNVANREPVTSIPQRGAVFAVAFSPDGRLLASGSGWGDDAVRLWDASTGKEAGRPMEHAEGVTCIAFSPDGRTLASGSWDRKVHLWDLASRERLAILSGHRDAVSSLAFSSDGRLLASASRDGTVRLWETASRKPLAILSGRTRGVTSIAFSPAGDLLAFGSDDHTVRLWQADALRAPLSLSDADIEQAQREARLYLQHDLRLGPLPADTSRYGLTAHEPR